MYTGGLSYRCFYYFCGWILLFAAICAAIGSAVGDDQGESQQIMMPFTLLIVMGLYLAMGAIRALIVHYPSSHRLFRSFAHGHVDKAGI